jgi:hypothetical protein
MTLRVATSIHGARHHNIVNVFTDAIVGMTTSGFAAAWLQVSHQEIYES